MVFDRFRSSNVNVKMRSLQLVSAEVFGACLQRSVTVAESRAPDSCHCNTPNCPGWAFHDDDDENFFHCPVCLAINCLTCHACHQSQTCRQYQTALREAAATDADNDAAARTQGVIQVRRIRAESCNGPFGPFSARSPNHVVYHRIVKKKMFKIKFEQLYAI